MKKFAVVCSILVIVLLFVQTYADLEEVSTFKAIEKKFDVLNSGIKTINKNLKDFNEKLGELKSIKKCFDDLTEGVGELNSQVKGIKELVLSARTRKKQ